MRFWSWFFLLAGVACLAGAGVLGVQAGLRAAEISAYHNAHACLAGAPADADCLQTVDGAVSGVTESAGGGSLSADYALDVETASTTLHLAFSSDSPMLGYAADGNPAVVTMWRGVPVSVVTDGRSQVTTSVPETAFARDLGNSEETGGVGVFLIVAAVAPRRNRRTGGIRPPTRPVLAAALMTLLLGAIVVVIGGFALGGRPSRLGPDLVATGAALVLVLGLAAWAAVKASAAQPPSQPLIPSAVPRHAAPPWRPLDHRRLHPARLARVLGTLAASFLVPGLTMAVLFGVWFTSRDGAVVRAYRHAPACSAETNLANCAGDFTAVINGVRSPANNAGFADVSYVTADGAINAWAEFDGNADDIARTAETEMSAGTHVRISVWRRRILGAELGGRWRWTDDNPPGNTAPAVFLAASFASLLVVVRLRIHRRARGRMAATWQRLLIDDLGQTAAAAGSVVLLAFGFWPGALLALAVLVWLALSASRSLYRRRSTVPFG